MRSALIRFLVVLIAFALVGNAHARGYLTPAEQPAPPGHHQQHHPDGAGKTGEHKPTQDKGVRCCCDALGCFSVYTVTPDPGRVTPVVFQSTVEFPVQVAVLQGQVLLPEPEPPRTIALT